MAPTSSLSEYICCYYMGKKQNQKQLPSASNPEVSPATIDKLSMFMLKRKNKELKDFMWKHCKSGRISGKTETIIREYLNEITDGDNIEDSIDESLRISEASYAKTSKIFKNPSLKEKYGSLLLGSMSEICEHKAEELESDEKDKLEMIKEVYKKYRVSSMFKSSLVKYMKESILDKFVRKGYLKEVSWSQNNRNPQIENMLNLQKTKGNTAHTILYLVS